ncbi:Tetratricopeptide TPR2 [Corynebacterium pseudotuberculosis]|uniref:hypothetical protein n=1 Tax=Corynebacterium pseudotuberculosis TaxID=1719 RepID=UPI00065E9145|nr:hypothetical protein [Corynebacterium pseudotuberculosis]AKP08622.1 Tetratricopeptide TPR2 [Corynebacterium pseudotuberculosis]
MADSHSREGRSQRGFKSRDGRRQGGERERRGESSWGRNDRHEGSNRRPGSQSDGRRESYGRRRDENDRKSGRPYDRDRKERFGDRGKRSEERRDDRRQRPKWDDDRRVPRQEDRRKDWKTGERRSGEPKRGGRSEYRRGDGDRSSRPYSERNGERRHSQRGGVDRNKQQRGPIRPGYREERINNRVNEPDLPDDIDVRDLDPMVLQDLKVLAKDNANAVAKHMIMAATWMADDPQLALNHARAAKDRAGRIAVVRETCGIAAYHAGEWKEALAELRAARRMSGGPGLIAVMADCERGLGRPEKAIELARDEDPASLDVETRIELAIVVAGARLDLGQPDAAVVILQRENPDAAGTGLGAVRLSYAYANALLAAGRESDAKEWFAIAEKQDVDGYTDASERLQELA